MEPLRVLVVADDALARNGLAALAAAAERVVVVDRVPPDEIEGVLRAEEADALLWDVGLDPVVDAEVLRGVTSAGLPVLAVVGGEAVVPLLLGGGVRGVVGRDAGVDRLSAALRALTAGLAVVDASLTDAALRRREPEDALVEPLTPREREVLALLADGLTKRAMRISEHTAKFHVNAVLGKLGVQTRAEAVAQAVRHGLLML
jgi:two-component system, NarL family, nitrate/nitrite response regulator NarL